MSLVLTDLCLTIIVRHFPRYNLAFNIIKDDDMKCRFEFLQRKYSFELLTRLSAQQESLEEYVDLLINKHLKVLDTDWLRNCTWEKVTSKIAEIGSSIESFKIQSQSSVTRLPPWKDVICYLPNLKSFTFQTYCDNPILNNVAKFCPNIEEVDVFHSYVSIEAVKRFCSIENRSTSCTKLKKLCIAFTYINDNDVKYLLKNLPSLEKLDYPNLPLVLYSLHKNDLSSLDKIMPYNITALDLKKFIHDPLLVNIKKVCFSVCPHLKTLILGLLSKNDLIYFPKLSDLLHLDIENFSNFEININDFLKSKGDKLMSLGIGNCTVSFSVLAESCPHVKELVLNRVHFHFDDDYSKLMFDSLTTCTFVNFDNSANARAITLLLSLSKNLKYLTFEACNLLSSNIKASILKYCKLHPIKEIIFYMSTIEKEYVKDILLNCKTLTYLNIVECFFREDEDELLEFSKTLPNNPKIDVGDRFNVNEFLNEIEEMRL